MTRVKDRVEKIKYREANRRIIVSILSYFAFISLASFWCELLKCNVLSASWDADQIVLGTMKVGSRSTDQRQVKESHTGYNQRTAARTGGGVDNIAKKSLRELGFFILCVRIWGKNSSMVFENIKVTFREEKTILISLSVVKVTEK